jgi:intracellular multiplication protein IcmL
MQTVDSGLGSGSDAELVVIDHNSTFQNEGNVKLRLVIMLQIAVVVTLCVFIYADWAKKPEPVYFNANEYNQIIKPVPLNSANLNHAAVLNWFTEAISTSFAFNYFNQEQKFAHLKRYYTESGLKKFRDAVANDPNLSGVEVEKLIVSMQVLEAPEVLQDGVVNGVYTWNIRLPIVIILQNQIKRQSMSVKIETIVVRVPEVVAPFGLLIDDFAIVRAPGSVGPAGGGLNLGF